VGASTTLAITVDPTAAPGTVLSDVASVAGDQADPVSSNNQATLALTLRGTSDLSITAGTNTSTNYVGQPITYTVAVTNSGPNDEPNAQVTVPFPTNLLGGVTVVANGSNAWLMTNGVLTVDLGVVSSGQTDTIKVTAIPLAAAAPSLASVFTVSGVNLDPNSVNNEATVTAPMTPASDLSVSIAASRQTPVAGVAWSYTLAAANLGLSTATDVTLTSPLPANTTFDWATDPAGAVVSVQQGVVSVNLGSLVAGASSSLTIEIDPSTAAIGGMELSGSVLGDQYDPNTTNNTATTMVNVQPSVDLGIEIAPSTLTVETGQSLTWSAVLINNGSVPASNVTVSFPVAGSLEVQSWWGGSGAVSMIGGQVVDNVGVLAPGAQAAVSVVVIPTVAGPLTQTAVVAAGQYNTDPSGGTASAVASVLESPGVLQWSAASVTVPETAGSAVFSVVRSLGSLGPVSVNYQTVDMNAAPGRDYEPVSGTLTFAAGQTVATVSVPVLADPYDNHDEYVSLQLSAATGGAVLGSQTSSTLQIQDVDPDFTPPTVSSVTWSGNAAMISTITLGFSAPLASAQAELISNYVLMNTAKGNRIDPIVAAVYNPATFSVTITPETPIPSNQYFELEAIGTGSSAIRDIAGNVLDGAGNGAPGSNYAVLIGQGRKLVYTDSLRHRVTLKLSNGGYLEQVRSLDGDGLALDLIDIAPGRSKLSGSIKASGRGGRSTALGVISGLGRFGTVRVTLNLPEFKVSKFPY
jgi:uncharacterized repeat protein (TIGR01451 family)